MQRKYIQVLMCLKFEYYYLQDLISIRLIANTYPPSCFKYCIIIIMISN